MKHAIKAGDKLRTETLRSLRAQLLEREIARRGQGDFTPDDEISVLQSAVKKRGEAIEFFEKGGRKHLVEQETIEISIIQEYPPQQLTTAEIESVVQGIIAPMDAISPKDIGKVMSAAMKELKGRADGKTVKDIAHRLVESKQ